jgi:hypothetical protein
MTITRESNHPICIPALLARGGRIAKLHRVASALIVRLHLLDNERVQRGAQAAEGGQFEERRVLAEELDHLRERPSMKIHMIEFLRYVKVN